MYTYAHTQQKYYFNFLLEFWNCLCNTNFLPMFPWAYKTYHIYTSCYGQPSVCSKRLWVDVCTPCSFHRWRFSLAQCRKVSEYWSQAILSPTQTYQRTCWNYYQPCCRCCFLHMVIKLKHKIYLPNVESFKQIPKENATKLFENLEIEIQQQINIILFMCDGSEGSSSFLTLFSTFRNYFNTTYSFLRISQTCPNTSTVPSTPEWCRGEGGGGGGGAQAPPPPPPPPHTHTHFFAK